MPPKLHSYFTRLCWYDSNKSAWCQTSTCIWKSLQNGKIQYCLPARIFGACPPPNIIALEQNDNQAAHKLYLRNIENLPYWPGIPFGKWSRGNKVLFIIVHYRAVKVITEMYLCCKNKWPLVPAACFCNVTLCLWITTGLVMCIYNESIYSIFNLKDVDSTLISPMLFWVIYLNRL